ncbi:unnamed protein product [Spirodela intermedia]|uniref:Uncharacterized protein n=1 Tax=Spirodela intermedia TaxID=51605 RepID=A0A7I8IKE7_SPIIN|nr:unnamed protein product [Spirodela intermedia]CAA6657457.1 unnamed protein product [Spirodela intermedia]
MEASCFITAKSFCKPLDVVSPARAAALVSGSLRQPTSSSSSPVPRCSLRSSSPPGEERGPAALDSDWRSFRAKLVAGERTTAAAATAAPFDPILGVAESPLGDRWAHPLHEPERGCLLVATERLDGVHIFERTVVLILSTGPVGPTGIILNRPSLMSIKETRSVALDHAGVFSNRPLFFGGPSRKGSSCGVFEEVMEGLYFGTKESVGCAAEMVKRDAVAAGDFRFFDGRCGWEGQQLREEIRAGYWAAVACSPSVVLAMDSARHWEEIVGLVWGRKVR